MSEMVQTDSEIFAGGPPFRWQRSLGLITPDNPRIIHRAVLAGVVGWVPLVVLAIVQDSAWGEEKLRALLLDFAVPARTLIAAPLFIFAESVCIPQLGVIVRHFLDAGLVPESERHRFDAALASTRRLLDSTTVEVITIVLAYILMVAMIHYVPLREFQVWHRSGSGESQSFSLAGWWHALVSLPLLSVLLLGWLWRLFLWGRLLRQISHLDLRLIPAHPDHAGGLQFLGHSLWAFSLLGFALGTIIAGSVADRVIHTGVPTTTHLYLIGGLLIVVVGLFSGPLLVFPRKLHEARQEGILAYGALAGHEGQQFERKWLNRVEPLDESALEVPDFSATTDLYQVAANVYEMGFLPFEPKDLSPLVVATLLPFIPVALISVPLNVLVQELTKLLL